MKRYLAKPLSKIFSYDNTVGLIRMVTKTADFVRFWQFDIYNKIPDEQCVIAFNHAFKFCGKVVDHYVIAASCSKKMVGIAYHELFKSEFNKPFLENWGTISTHDLIKIKKILKQDEVIAIAPEGPEHIPAKNGYLGVAWIAKQCEIPILPVKITAKKRYVRLEPKPKILVPKDADKLKLREITDLVMEELK